MVIGDHVAGNEENLSGRHEYPREVVTTGLLSGGGQDDSRPGQSDQVEDWAETKTRDEEEQGQSEAACA